MSEYALTAKRNWQAGSFYDRIVRYYKLTYIVNGYGRALDQYFDAHPLPLASGARVLDAGCGPGLLTLALLRTLDPSVQLTAIDLSGSSVETARKAVTENNAHGAEVQFAQSNILSLPFADHSFDAVVTSGVLEYVPLDDGLRELARVIAPGGHLLHLPIKASPITSFLQLMFRFRIHPPRAIAEGTERYFRLVNHYRFPRLQLISWTRSAILAQKF